MNNEPKLKTYDNPLSFDKMFPSNNQNDSEIIAQNGEALKMIKDRLGDAAKHFTIDLFSLPLRKSKNKSGEENISHDQKTSSFNDSPVLANSPSFALGNRFYIFTLYDNRKFVAWDNLAFKNFAIIGDI